MGESSTGKPTEARQMKVQEESNVRNILTKDAEIETTKKKEHAT